MKLFVWKRALSVLATTTVCLAFTLSLSAQVETKTTTATGKAAVVTKVERGEVVTVSGNDLVVKMANGSIRHIENVPESARVTVDGKQLGIHDLTPGMKLQRTITTTTIPKTITTVQSVKGKVWAINPPSSVILTLENGQNQQFKIPKDQKFKVDGQMVDAWGVRKGMTITATKIVEVPTVEIIKKKRVTGEAAPEVATEAAPEVAEALPPTPPPSDVPILVAEGNETPVPPPPAEPATTAPEAPGPSSMTWLVAFLALLVLAGAITWRVMRKRHSSL